VPERAIEKRKVGFFSHAIDGWFRAQTKGLVSDYLLGPNPRYSEMLDRRGVEQLVSLHGEGDTPENGRLLLAILMLEIWLATYLPRATPTGSEHPTVERIVLA
jgi:hypothetical protein